MIRPLTACLIAGGISCLALPAAPATVPAAVPVPAPARVHVQDVQQDVRRLPLVLPLPVPSPTAGRVGTHSGARRYPAGGASRPAPAPAGAAVRTATPPAAPAGPTAAQLPQERIGRQIDCPNGTVGTQRADGTVDCPVAP